MLIRGTEKNFKVKSIVPLRQQKSDTTIELHLYLQTGLNLKPPAAHILYHIISLSYTTSSPTKVAPCFPSPSHRCTSSSPPQTTHLTLSHPLCSSCKHHIHCPSSLAIAVVTHLHKQTKPMPSTQPRITISHKTTLPLSLLSSSAQQKRRLS